jgi:DNA-binding IscR family transcriptional regulator
MLTVHANANPACPVGARIECTLRAVYQRAEKAMFDELAKTSIRAVIDEMALTER